MLVAATCCATLCRGEGGKAYLKISSPFLSLPASHPSPTFNRPGVPILKTLIGRTLVAIVALALALKSAFRLVEFPFYLEKR